MRIPIVNEQDEIITYKDREDRNSKDCIRITAVWITDESGNVLLQQRGLNKKRSPGKWGPAVSGTVEEGETYEANAYKETTEEIGVSDVILTIDKKVYGFSMTGGKRFCQLFTVKISKDTKLIPEKEEVEQLKWFSKDELKAMFLNDPNSFVGLMEDLKNFFL